MELLHTETLQSAREKLLEFLRKQQMKIEYLELMYSEGRILAEDIRSNCAIPAFRRSTVDGYAVLATDTHGASESIPVLLKVLDEVNIGQPAKTRIQSGECVYVPTGGMVPDGADAVVMVEYCELFDEANLAVYESVSVGRNLVNIGEDFNIGEVILSKGTKLRPQELGALASAGVAAIPVYKKMKLTIISTGDELVPLDKTPEPGQIRDINTYALEAHAKKRGFDVEAAYVLTDDEELLRTVVAKSMKNSDLIVVSGGSSKGIKDITAKILDELSEPGVFVHGISVKPGKPTILGYDEYSHTGLIGLPGHPAAAMIIFELIVVWVKDKLEGRVEEKCIYAGMETNLAGDWGKTTCHMVKLIDKEDGYIASSVFGKSGLMSTLTAADGYTLIDMNKEGLQKGELVKVYLL